MRIHRQVGLLLTGVACTNAFITPTPSAKIVGRTLEPLSAVEKKFENDGLFSFMQPVLPLIGFSEGRTTYYGPAVKVDESDYPSEEEQQMRREKAEEEMTNIGQDERDRRRYAGEIAYKVSIGYAIVSSLFLDDGSFNGHIARFLLVLPLFFASGYTKSADTGL